MPNDLNIGRRALRRSGEAIERKTLVDARGAAAVGANAAARRAPIDTGRLRRSIRAVDTPEGADIVAGTDYAAIQAARTGFFAEGADAARTELKRRGY